MDGGLVCWVPNGKEKLALIVTDVQKRAAHSFLRATLPENCSLLGTDNVRGQISEVIFF